MGKLAILIDGGFLRYELHRTMGNHPTADDIDNYSKELLNAIELRGVYSLLRVYYYDCLPSSQHIKNPISNETIRMGSTEQARQGREIIENLELKPDFAVRKGVLAYRGWSIKPRSERRIFSGNEPVTANDIKPDMAQKGVDMRIDLDISWLAIKRIVGAVVLVTGDSDFIPAMKLARKEGLRIYLDCMGKSVNRELKVHADIVLDPITLP